MAPGQEQRAAAERAAQLAEGDDRAGEGDRADEHADLHLDVVREIDRRCPLPISVPMPTSTAATPTKLCSMATSSGIAVICTRAATRAADERAEREAAAVELEHVVGRAHRLAALEPEEADDADGDGEHHADDAEQVAALRASPASTARASSG